MPTHLSPDALRADELRVADPAQRTRAASGVHEAPTRPWTVRVRDGVVRHAWSPDRQRTALHAPLASGELDYLVGAHLPPPPAVGAEVDPLELGWVAVGPAN